MLVLRHKKEAVTAEHSDTKTGADIASAPVVSDDWSHSLITLFVIFRFVSLLS